MNINEMAEVAARGAYAANGWWRSVLPDDDGKGRYQNIKGALCRAVEWGELEPEDREEAIQNTYHGLLALIEAGLVFMPPPVPHVPRVEPAS
jgi:hypothetical protein